MITRFKKNIFFDYDNDDDFLGCLKMVMKMIIRNHMKG